MAKSYIAYPADVDIVRDILSEVQDRAFVTKSNKNIEIFNLVNNSGKKIFTIKDDLSIEFDENAKPDIAKEFLESVLINYKEIGDQQNSRLKTMLTKCLYILTSFRNEIKNEEKLKEIDEWIKSLKNSFK